MYLYRTIDAKCFLQKALACCYVIKRRSITADKAYPAAIRKRKEEKYILQGTLLRLKKYLNNIIEQDYRFIKK